MLNLKLPLTATGYKEHKMWIEDANGKDISTEDVVAGYNALAAANEKLAARVAELERENEMMSTTIDGAFNAYEPLGFSGGDNVADHILDQ